MRLSPGTLGPEQSQRKKTGLEFIWLPSHGQLGRQAVPTPAVFCGHTASSVSPRLFHPSFRPVAFPTSFHRALSHVWSTLPSLRASQGPLAALGGGTKQRLGSCEWTPSSSSCLPLSLGTTGGSTLISNSSRAREPCLVWQAKEALEADEENDAGRGCGVGRLPAWAPGNFAAGAWS